MDDEGEFELQLRTIKLKTVRQFYLESVSLNEHFSKIGKKSVNVLDVEDFCSRKIEEMIRQAAEEHSGDPQQPELPLIRLRVDYTDEYLTLSANHFGQRFVGKVANPKELILFKCKKGFAPKVTADSNLEMIEDIVEDMYYENGEQSKQCTHIDDVINEYFDNVEPQSKLCLLAEKKLTDAVKEIVDKDPQSAKLNIIIDWHINAIKEHFMSKNNLDQILEDKFLIREMMTDFKAKLRQKEETDNKNLIDFEELAQQYGRKRSNAAPKQPKVTKQATGAGKGRGRGKKKSKNDDEEDEESPVEISDGENTDDSQNQFGIVAVNSSTDEDEDQTPAKKTSTGRGRGRGAAKTPSTRGRGRGRGKGKELSDFFTVSK